MFYLVWCTREAYTTANCRYKIRLLGVCLIFLVITERALKHTKQRCWENDSQSHMQNSLLLTCPCACTSIKHMDITGTQFRHLLKSAAMCTADEDKVGCFSSCFMRFSAVPVTIGKGLLYFSHIKSIQLLLPVSLNK